MDNPVEYFTTMQASQGWAVILESFARFVAPPKHASVLDVGTGPGALVNLFRQHFEANAFGIDYDPRMTARAASIHDAPFVCGRLPSLPFAKNTFEIITATNVLYLLDDPLTALTEIVRVLARNGTFVMLNPSSKMSIAAATALADERSLIGFERENFILWGTLAESKIRWSEAEIDALFAQVGLQLTETRERIGMGLALYARGAKI